MCSRIEFVVTTWHNDMTWWHVGRMDGWGWGGGGRGRGEEGWGIVEIVGGIDRMGWDGMWSDETKS